jgi:hypothetical protein
MGQMWHAGRALVALMAIACSGGEGNQPEPEPGGGTETNDEGSEAALQFAIDGRSDPLGAQARLDVQQGEEAVHLAITGADGGNDFVVFDIYFAGVESTMGDHVIELGLPMPDRVVDFVNASFDGESYYSQAGQIQLTLAEDGAIEGHFEVNLAHDETLPGSPPVPNEDSMMLTGGFEGSWTLICQSRLPGHESLVRGGVFCEELEF